jgi:hypothetical protein
VQEEVENILHEIMCSPMPIFDGCFAESLCKYSMVRLPGLGFGVCGSRFRVQGLGFRVQGLWVKV